MNSDLSTLDGKRNLFAWNCLRDLTETGLLIPSSATLDTWAELLSEMLKSWERQRDEHLRRTP